MAKLIGAILVVALVGGLGYLTGRQIYEGPPPTDPTRDPILVEATERTVERTITLGGEAGWPTVGVIKVRRDGIVTSIADGLVVLSSGAEIARINERPVIIAQGDVPAYRSLESGVVGDDVRQLQSFLTSEGFDAGIADSRFGSATVRAVRAWQETSGFPVNGRVELGDIVWVPDLPATLRLAEGVEVDADVTSGETIFEQVAQAPLFRVSLSWDQVNLIPQDAEFLVSFNERDWPVRVMETVSTDAAVEYTFDGRHETPVCGSECGLIPVGAPTPVDVRITIVPRMTGPAVPAAGVQTDPMGEAYVETANGSRAPVTVLGIVDGVAVVDGIDIGELIRLPES